MASAAGSVIDCIESAGGIVFDCEFRSRKVDGISKWPQDDNVPPVFLINGDIPGDCQRFTLSHEIGHIVLHHRPCEDAESEADAFASEFLMPEEEIEGGLEGLTLTGAAELKPLWSVSIAALVRRAFDLGKITERKFRYLNMQISSLGYRECEPLPIPREEPALFDAILDVHRTSHRSGVEELSDALGMHPNQFEAKYGHGTMGIRLVG